MANELHPGALTTKLLNQHKNIGNAFLPENVSKIVDWIDRSEKCRNCDTRNFKKRPSDSTKTNLCLFSITE